MNYVIDLNCDMGEYPEAIADGTQEQLMAWVTSVNIACGGHAGDSRTMEATIREAQAHGLAIGAHPGYPDPANFGRIELDMQPAAISDFVHQQVASFAQIAAQCGAAVTHVKPHGALYNQAARDPSIAQAIADGVARWSTGVVLVGLAGSRMLEVFGQCFRVGAEAFADRRYEPDGSLRSRRFPDALIHDPQSAAEQAIRIVRDQSVVASGGAVVPLRAQTLCIHGDTPGAVEIAAAVAAALKNAGIALQGLNAAYFEAPPSV